MIQWRKLLNPWLEGNVVDSKSIAACKERDPEEFLNLLLGCFKCANLFKMAQINSEGKILSQNDMHLLQLISPELPKSTVYIYLKII